jgi:hypothetical protein
MSKRYVVFLNEDGSEVYVVADFYDEIVTSGDSENALGFTTARHAYEWAGHRKLDSWQVGMR